MTAQNEQSTWHNVGQKRRALRAAQNELDAQEAGEGLEQRQERQVEPLQAQWARESESEVEVEDSEQVEAQQARLEPLEAPPPQDEVAEHWSDLQSNELNQHLIKTTWKE